MLQIWSYDSYLKYVHSYLFVFSIKVINLDQNDAAMSVALCKFPHMDPTSTFCLVGVAKDYQLSPRSVGGGSVHVYRIIHGGTGLELIHRTAVDEIPYAIHSFQNKVGDILTRG